MKILYVYGMSTAKDIPYNLRKLGYKVDEYPHVQKNSILNDEEIDKLTAYVKKHRITHLMSTHLIYNIAVAAYQTGIKYVSVIWDAPYLKMYTPFGRLDNCWFSVFDKLDYERFQKDGIPHVMYQPLAVNKYDILKWNVKRKMSGKYFNDICFLGRLYEKNLYDDNLSKMPEQMQQYFTSIFEEAAFKWDGENRVYGQTPGEILDYIKLVSPEFELDNIYDVEDVRYFEVQYLIRKIANIERICTLNVLAEQFPVSFYTDSQVEPEQLGGVKIMPPVMPGEASTIIFAGSKINLNISLKGIEGGTPQRIMDILGSGGFALTNYCAETAELFEEDKEIVMFRTPEELVEKAEYYLVHDKEREEIANAGYRKVMNCYTYDRKLKQLMEWVEKET
ncbi:MAG: glycosyltransferase [Lachnospiraceae bacterium]|nr:glycosyltransferase [Lachnospiraceae bacterium]